MSIKKHLILALIAISAWAFFYFLGLPSDYFHKWSLNEQILLTLITVFGATPFIAFITIILMREDYFKTGIWMAFYGSVLLLLLDFAVCGIFQGKGFGIILSHWYLTLGYFYVWIICPLTGYTLKVFKKEI